ncbi:MAG: DUF1295 domain-containing protein [Firmicutes bacterium]|nr:DUF1295 domain-containing protein [Bacillota bacterium]
MLNLKKNYSIIIMISIYLIALILGAFSFYICGLIVSNILFQTIVFEVIATLVVWGFGLLFKNASTYDPYWSVIPPIIILSWIFILKSSLTIGVLLLVISIFVWGIRLTYNWYINWQDLTKEDWRYQMIKEKAPKVWFLSNLFGINLMPTTIVFIQLIGAYSFLKLGPQLNYIIVLGFIMSLSASVIQFISDKQMRAFRLSNIDKKKCINEGLWSVSRHPNYFGEVLMWWGLWVMYFGAFRSIDLMLVAPILMNALFLFISIPMMEKKILISRPEYSDYQQKVSILLPFFPKRKSEEMNEFQQSIKE